mgnify:FL=1
MIVARKPGFDNRLCAGGGTGDVSWFACRGDLGGTGHYVGWERTRRAALDAGHALTADGEQRVNVPRASKGDLADPAACLRAGVVHDRGVGGHPWFQFMLRVGDGDVHGEDEVDALLLRLYIPGRELGLTGYALDAADEDPLRE